MIEAMADRTGTAYGSYQSWYPSGQPKVVANVGFYGNFYDDMDIQSWHESGEENIFRIGSHFVAKYPSGQVQEIIACDYYGEANQQEVHTLYAKFSPSGDTLFDHYLFKGDYFYEMTDGDKFIVMIQRGESIYLDITIGGMMFSYQEEDAEFQHWTTVLRNTVNEHFRTINYAMSSLTCLWIPTEPVSPIDALIDDDDDSDDDTYGEGDVDYTRYFEYKPPKRHNGLFSKDLSVRTCLSCFHEVECFPCPRDNCSFGLCPDCKTKIVVKCGCGLLNKLA
jgi:hypothetical protein